MSGEKVEAPGIPDAVRHRSAVVALPEGPGPAIIKRFRLAARLRKWRSANATERSQLLGRRLVEEMHAWGSETAFDPCCVAA